jgi:hypothetical protein
MNLESQAFGEKGMACDAMHGAQAGKSVDSIS